MENFVEGNKSFSVITIEKVVQEKKYKYKKRGCELSKDELNFLKKYHLNELGNIKMNWGF